jgi:hypothetical protein
MISTCLFCKSVQLLPPFSKGPLIICLCCCIIQFAPLSFHEFRHYPLRFLFLGAQTLLYGTNRNLWILIP